MSLKGAWESFGERFGNTVFHPQYFAKKQADVGRGLAVKYAKGVVLDIGPGTAPYRAAIEPKVVRYLTLDHPQVARLYDAHFKLNYQADASVMLPLATASVDTVLLLMVLEHLTDPRRALQEISRILKPGGILVLSTIQTYPLHDPPYDYFRYTQFALTSLLNQAGFKVRLLRSQGTFLTTLCLLINVQIFQTLKAIAGSRGGKPFAIVLSIPAIIATFVLNCVGLVLGWMDLIHRLDHSHAVVALKPRGVPKQSKN